MIFLIPSLSYQIFMECYLFWLLHNQVILNTLYFILLIWYVYFKNYYFIKINEENQWNDNVHWSVKFVL